MTEKFSFIASPPRFVPPPGSCDSHIHVFGPAKNYPHVEGRTYTPPDALPEDAMTMLRTLGMERVVLVQPSIYGTDNSRMLDAMATFGEMARGVAVVADDVGKMELERLHAAGVRGLRLNVESVRAGEIEELTRRMSLLARSIRDLNWHLELHVGPHLLEALVPVVERLPVDVVFDHMAKIPADDVVGHPGLAAVKRMLGTGRCWVKLSGAYRVSRKGGKYTEVAQLARSLVETNPDRMVWGSDWPHTPPHGHEPVLEGEITPFRKLDTGRLLDLLMDWVPDERVRKHILVDNPARLYDFD
ncbi:MAG: amidohydrolase family protein [Proteobacteria bacterium]|nr:amidohydrolase family protein [Pseudomonadota bacterium]